MRNELDKVLAIMFTNVLYKDYLFYAHMIAKCNIKLDEKMTAPAAVSFKFDHYELILNPTLFYAYPIHHRMGILKHEMLHICYNHFLRFDELVHKDLKKWNYATDCAINQHIDADHLPDNCITPAVIEKMSGKSVALNESAEYYYSLLENMDNPEVESFDSHDGWEESDEYLKSDVTKNMINNAISETIRDQGKLPMHIDRFISLNSVKSTISWQKYTKRFISSKINKKIPTIKRLNRRFQDREDIKGKKKTKGTKLLLLLDVSGSQSDIEITEQLNEVKNVCQDVCLIQVDSEAREPEYISKSTKRIQRKGNGGTMLYAGIVKAKECKIEYDFVIVLTDGYLFPNDFDKFKKLKNVMFLITKKGTTKYVNSCKNVQM